MGNFNWSCNTWKQLWNFQPSSKEMQQIAYEEQKKTILSHHRYTKWKETTTIDAEIRISFLMIWTNKTNSPFLSIQCRWWKTRKCCSIFNTMFHQRFLQGGNGQRNNQIRHIQWTRENWSSDGACFIITLPFSILMNHSSFFLS